MTGGSLGIALRASSLRLQSSFSSFSCWSVVLKKRGYSLAIAVDSMFTSIVFVGTASLIFKRIFSLVSNSKRDKKMCCGVHFPWNVCNSKIKLQYKVAGIP